MSIFRNRKTGAGSTRRVRVRHVLPLLLLMLVPIYLAQAGSAARPPVTNFEVCVQNAGSPACGGTATSVFAGNTVATVTATVENDSASTLAIQSADVNVPNQLKVKANGTVSPAANVTLSGQQVRIRGIKVQPGRAFVATFQVYVACGGQFDWPAQQAFTGDNETGTGFTYQPGSSTGVSTTITTACHLGFSAQPTDTQSGHPIADGGASNGGPVKVGLFTGASGTTPMTSCPVGYATCSVSVDSSPAGVNAQSVSLDSNAFVAPFSTLTITIPATDTADQFNLAASPTEGSFVPPVASSSFLVAQTVTGFSCPGSSCTTGNGHQQVVGQNLAPSFVDVTSSTGFNFLTVSPFTLSSRAQPPVGCTGIPSIGVTGFAESDSRQPGSGTLTITFYVNKDILSARYGKNVGNQFIPMCVGARPVDVATGTIHDCNDPNFASTGWLGDGISGTGKFTGKSARAVCDADGYYYGIISSYQDKLDATANPTVTGWNGQQINGDNYRSFTMNVPPSWDWRSGP